MMRRGGGRRLARYEGEDEERVVYYDLDTDSHSCNLLLSPDAVPAPSQPRATSTTTADGLKGGSQIFARQQQPLFNLDESGDEAEQEEENPFASLLQQRQQQTADEAEEESGRAASGTSHKKSFLHAGASATAASGSASMEDEGQRTMSNNSTADSRPARWSTRKPSAADTKNRRKSLSAIQQRRSQLEAASSKRRKSMPPTLSSSQPAQTGYSMDDSMTSNSAARKKRLLSDVLQRATTLSQQLNTPHDGSTFSQTPADENSTDGDAILDTEHQMRAETFAPQIFSPTKPASTKSAIGRKSKSDGLAPKIRGSIGDVIRKAIRKSNRDLTLLRSQGQHLLPQQTNPSSAMGVLGAVESIQERAYIIVCLKRSRAVNSYECYVHEVTAKLKGNTANMIKEKHSMVLEALFQPQAAQFLKLSPGKMVKIYEPFHFVAEQAADGSTSKPKWFLLCTQLAEVIEANHSCCDGNE
ncbi:uncharacterized protein KRP23_2027 [Phytophthora ramorum]|uniref:uncharacterized protein n=1 Tax=Phytophthora ramorum TaxID=164328 RepID=UPI0030AE81A8|nr:hypothetical protein KRP23_2027 [Phytophthora ramorum]